jgi:hypothetical protein
MNNPLAKELAASGLLTALSRIDTAWWHDYVARYADEFRFVRGRLRFERPDGTRGAPAPVPSVVLIFRGRLLEVGDGP